MSFSFNFADQDELEDESIASDAQNPIPDRSDRKQDEGKEENDVPCQEWKLQDLVSEIHLFIINWSGSKADLCLTLFL